MKTQFSCPACHAKYQADSQLAGRSGKCKSCGSLIKVPETIQDTKSARRIDITAVRSNQSRLAKGRLFLMAKVVWVIFISIIFLGVGFKFGYEYYQFSQLKEKLEYAIGKNAGYTETILKVESEASRMSYSELFDLCEKSIEDRTNLIVELRGLYPNIDYEIKEKLIEFLNHENELIRSKRTLYRDRLTFSSIAEMAQDYLSDLPSSPYALDYYMKRANKLKTELIDLVSKIEASSDDFKSNYLKLVEQETALAKSMKAEGIRFTAIFTHYKDLNIKFAVESKSTAQEIKKKLI